MQCFFQTERSGMAFRDFFQAAKTYFNLLIFLIKNYLVTLI